jgi:hypothetical protein
MTMTPKTRVEIVRIISENLETFGSHEHIEALFAVTVEDLIAGGVEPVRVMSAMIRAWTRLEEAEIGKVGVIEVLRNLADAHERHQATTHGSQLPH